MRTWHIIAGLNTDTLLFASERFATSAVYRFNLPLPFSSLPLQPCPFRPVPSVYRKAIICLLAILAFMHSTVIVHSLLQYFGGSLVPEASRVAELAKLYNMPSRLYAVAFKLKRLDLCVIPGFRSCPTLHTNRNHTQMQSHVLVTHNTEASQVRSQTTIRWQTLRLGENQWGMTIDLV